MTSGGRQRGKVGKDGSWCGGLEMGGVKMVKDGSGCGGVGEGEVVERYFSDILPGVCEGAEKT